MSEATSEDFQALTQAVRHLTSRLALNEHAFQRELHGLGQGNAGQQLIVAVREVANNTRELRTDLDSIADRVEIAAGAVVSELAALRNDINTLNAAFVAKLGNGHDRYDAPARDDG